MSVGESSGTSKSLPRIGSYRLIQPLGSGGMSSVFRAVHEESGNEVAVKVLPRTLAKNSTLLQRFLREAKSAESLEHPNIVSIFDRGIDQGRHYLVLEFVPGGDFHDFVREQGPLDIADAVSVVRGVAEGLRYAATRGLIHRDIKPANLLRAPDGRVKIIDLGLALQSENEDERVTREGTTVGTVDYMSPEQARDSRATSIRSDIYSLGCTFYYLLTAAPPFPGGNIADKLTKHCTQPPPDPRKIRPEIPGPLALLVQRMMAKKPDNRFADYDELIAALDVVPTTPDASAEPAGDAPLDAILAEDDDEDSDDAIELELAEPEPEPTPAKRRERPSSQAEFSIAELAALDDDSPPRPVARRPSSSGNVPARGGSKGEPDSPRGRHPADAPSSEEEEVEGKLVGPPPASAYGGMDPATKKWIKTLVGASVAVVLLIIGIDQLVKSGTSSGTPPPVAEEGVEAGSATAQPVAPAEPPTMIRPRPQPRPNAELAAKTPAPGPSVKAPILAKEASKDGTASNVSWVEPGEPAPEKVPEPDYSAPVEDRFIPGWAKAPIPEKVGTTFLGVRRVVDPGNASQRNSLRAAFETIGGTVEVQDDGPLGEDDLRLRGDARLVRAGAGRRPIIKIEAPKLAVVSEQPAVFVLDNEQLILDGLNVIVNVQDLPRNQNALFHCRGSSLTLRNCTITVANPNATPFALVRMGGESSSRIRLESTLVRGSVLTILDVPSGGVEFAAIRSVLVGGTGPLFAFAGMDANATRQLSISRSLCATKGTAFEIDANARGGKVSPLTVRALGSTFARFLVPGETEGGPPLVVLREEGTSGVEALNWLGEFNVYTGWSGWLSGAIGRPAKLANLAAVRRAWPKSDAQSQESAAAWTARGGLDRISLGELKVLAPERLATLTRVAAPSPFLFEKSIDNFPRPIVPALATRLTEIPTTFPPAAVVAAIAAAAQAAARPVASPVAPVARPPVSPGVAPRAKPTMAPGTFAPPGRPVRPGQRPPGPPPPIVNVIASAAPAPPPSVIRDLVFNTAEPRWAGDLGLFLRDTVKEGDRCVRVWVSGKGAFPFTPYRAPEKTSLEILVDNRPLAGGVPTWSPVATSDGPPLLDVRGGDLVLSNVQITRNAAAQTKHILRVEDGHLVLSSCRLASSGTVANGGGDLIWFRAVGTKPMAAKEWAGPFETVVDRPVLRAVDSVLIAGGDTIAAELGRGLVALTHCVDISGGTALGLIPSNVARNRFEADLWLDHCSLAAEKNFVRIGAWPGPAPGPDRPWLIATQECAFLASFQPASRESVLLRFAPTAMSMGVPFWQGNGDAFEVINFAVRGDFAPPPNSFPDVRRQWVSLWGANHFRNVTGPSRASAASVRPVARFRPGRVDVADLKLDPDYHPGRSSLSIGADLRRLPVPPAAPRPERPR